MLPQIPDRYIYNIKFTRIVTDVKARLKAETAARITAEQQIVLQEQDILQAQINDYYKMLFKKLLIKSKLRLKRKQNMKRRAAARALADYEAQTTSKEATNSQVTITVSLAPRIRAS